MIKRITEAIQGIFHTLSYELVVVNGNETEYREIKGATHIPRIGETIGVPMQCDRHSKGILYLTARDVSYPVNGIPKVIVNKQESRHTEQNPQNPLERKAG